MENNTPPTDGSHDTYVGFALIFLSVAGLDSKFDPATLAQLAELLVTIVSGLIGAYIIINKKFKVKNGDATIKTDTGTKQAATLTGEQQTNNELSNSVRGNSEWGK